MIIFNRIWKDLVLHFVIVYVLLSTRNFSQNELLTVSLVSSMLLTLLNHIFLPSFRGENFQGCYLRWGVPPSKCPFRPNCPHQRMCDFARERTV